MKDRSFAASTFDLTGRNIHVIPVSTVASPEVTAHFESLLSPDERTRAAAFRFPHLRDSFILARGALRILLARYLDLTPASIQFTYGPKGKPALAASPLNFNASHSGDLAVFAFTAGCEIGIDVEQIRHVPDMQNIANRFFSREEARELVSLPEDHREQAFFHCWTRKEAYIKATGDGLSAPQPGDRAAPDWKLCDLQLAQGYAAALAYRAAPRPLTISPLMDPSELLA